MNKKKKISEILKSKGRRWITNGEINKLVVREELDYYISNGFYFGKTSKSDIKKGDDLHDC